MRCDDSGGKFLSKTAIVVSSLQVRVASEMLTSDEDVGHGSLSGLLRKSVLDGVTVSDLVELDDLEGNALGLECLLGAVAVGAVALGVHHDLVGGDLGVDVSDEVFSLDHSFNECVFLDF